MEIASAISSQWSLIVTRDLKRLEIQSNDRNGELLRNREGRIYLGSVPSFLARNQVDRAFRLRCKESARKIGKVSMHDDDYDDKPATCAKGKNKRRRVCPPLKGAKSPVCTRPRIETRKRKRRRPRYLPKLAFEDASFAHVPAAVPDDKSTSSELCTSARSKRVREKERETSAECGKRARDDTTLIDA